MFSVLYAARITMLRSMYSVAAVETAAMKIPSYVLGLEEKKKRVWGDEMIFFFIKKKTQIHPPHYHTRHTTAPPFFRSFL